MFKECSWSMIYELKHEYSICVIFHVIDAFEHKFKNKYSTINGRIGT